MIESRLLTIRIFSVRAKLKIGQQILFVIESVLKTDPWTYETKD